MGSLGWPEIMAILVIALVIFGPRKLPQLGRTLGKALGEFRRATNDLKNTLELEVHKEEETLNAGQRKKREDEYSRRSSEKRTSTESEFPESETPVADPKPNTDDASAAEEHATPLPDTQSADDPSTLDTDRE